LPARRGSPPCGQTLRVADGNRAIGCRTRFLRGVIGERYVAGDPTGSGRRGRPGVAQCLLDPVGQRGAIGISGRTSTEPYFADGIVAA
jgi:hypothetical protein